MEKDSTFLGPQVCMVGVNYGTSPLSVRERLGIPKGRLQDALASLMNYVPKGVILATCNRTEIYALDDGHDQGVEQAICQFLMDWSEIPETSLGPCLHCCRNDAAMRHLAETAAGLSSMIIGEHEILGQVRQALEEAEEAGMVSLPLRKLFQHAISVGRRARDETEVSRNALSVSSVAVDLATKVTGNIAGCRALLIGAGEAGKLVARALAARGVARLAVTSRSLKNAQQLASALGGEAVDISGLPAEIQAADILITCTGAPHFVVHRELVERVSTSRAGRPLVIVDIAVPRDVEPEVGEMDGVFLYDIDDLDQVSAFGRIAREREVTKAMAVIDREMDYLVSWWRALDVEPTVSALMQMAERIRHRQLALTMRKLPPMAQEERDSLEAMTRAIVTKVLCHPIQCLRDTEHRDGDLAQTVRRLFALDGQGP